MPPQFILDFLFHHASAHPNRPALFWQDKTRDFRTLAGEVIQCAKLLSDYGVQPDTHVGIVSRNSLYWAVVSLAVWLRGAVLVPVNHRLTEEERTDQLQNADVDILFHSRKVGAAIPGIKGYELQGLDWGHIRADTGSSMSVNPGDLAGIFHTSGTTGRPRGVMLTHGNFLASARASAANLGVHPKDRWLASLPLDHIGGFSILTRSLLNGTAIVLHPGFSPDAVLKGIRKDRITLLSLVPTMLRRLLNAGPESPPRLRGVLLGGGPSPENLLERAAAAGLPVLKTFGMTETCSQITTVPPGEAGHRLVTAGRPLAGVEITILDDQGEAVPDGETGEIAVRGPMVTAGYWNDPESTAELVQNGWLHTGDYGHLDGDGYLHVVMRRTDRIVTGGENVNPLEVEAELRKRSSVGDVCVFGRPHPEWGEEVCAAVVPAPGITLSCKDCASFTLERLAPYKRPKRYFLVEEIPRNPRGKPVRAALRERYTSGKQ